MAVAIGMIVLFVASIFSGYQIEQREAAAKQQQPKPAAVQPVREYQPAREYQPNAEAESVNRVEAVDVPTEEMMIEAQDVAQKFTEAYVPFDAEDPDHFLEKVEPYVTASFWEMLQTEQRRGTLTTVKTIVTEVELLPLKEGSSEQWWTTNVNVEHIGSQGEKEQSLLPYVLKIRLDDGKWKVDDLALNTRAWNP